METPMSYCRAVQLAQTDRVHQNYHDNAYGFPIEDDNELFARLVLEINQAGLSWTTILKKEKNFYKAYEGFELHKVAAFDEQKIAQLMGDAGIIRNRLKIRAAIENANRILVLKKEFGTFKNWLDLHCGKGKEEWTKLFKNTFKFTGGEIVNEFLMSTGYLPGAHEPTCPIYKKVLHAKPAWLSP